MKREYDFSKGERGPILTTEKGKTRISIFLDNAVLKGFRKRAEKSGVGYQTMINDALRTHLQETPTLLTEKALRKILRQEIAPYIDMAGRDDLISPVTPGEMLLEEFMKPANLSPARLAKAIGVGEDVIAELLAGKRSISGDLDLRLSYYFGLSKGWWSRCQASHDRSVAAQVMGKELAKIKPHKWAK